MRVARCALGIGLLFVFALCTNVMARDASPTITKGADAFAQADNSSVTTRFTRWTRARLEAAKKHWAEDQQRFSECTEELDKVKKKSGRRLSYHRQGHFLEKCMREKR